MVVQKRKLDNTRFEQLTADSIDPVRGSIVRNTHSSLAWAGVATSIEPACLTFDWYGAGFAAASRPLEVTSWSSVLMGPRS
jgi:hypothetical protein